MKLMNQLRCYLPPGDCRAIYEEAVRRENKSVAERIMDITRVRELPTSPGLQPARGVRSM